MSDHYDKNHGWVIRSTFRDSGDTGWWGEGGPWFERHDTLVGLITKAHFYADESIAHETAHQLKASRKINDYTVERYQRPPLRTGTEGSSGRA